MAGKTPARVQRVKGLCGSLWFLRILGVLKDLHRSKGVQQSQVSKGTLQLYVIITGQTATDLKWYGIYRCIVWRLERINIKVSSSSSSNF